MNRSVLRTYVRQVLAEDASYGGGDEFGGMDFTGGDQRKLYSIFVEPFVDVVKTTAGETKQLSTRVQTLVKVVFQALVSTFIPTFGSEFDKIFDEEEERLESIKREYSDVYERTWKAVKDNDILSAAFMYDPAGLITTAVIRKSPVQVMNLLNVLSGGLLDSTVKKIKKIKPPENDVRSMLVTMLKSNMSGAAGAAAGLAGLKGESRLVEAKGTDLFDAVRSNPRVQQMMNHARKIVRSGLEEQFDLAATVLTSDNVEKLAAGRNVKGINDLKKLQEPERAQAESAVLKAIKQSTKKLFVEKFEKRIKEALDLGVPREHPYITDHVKTLQKIKNHG